MQTKPLWRRFYEQDQRSTFDIFETLSENSQQFSTKGFKEVKLKDAYEMRASGGDSTRIAAIEEKLDAMMKNMSLQGAAQVEVCAYCSTNDHITSLCPYSAASQEQIRYMGQQRPRNDGNVPLAFRWGTNAGVSTYQQGANNNYKAPPPGFTQAPRPQNFNPYPPHQSSSKLEDLVLSIANDTKSIMQDNKAFKDKTENTF